MNEILCGDCLQVLPTLEDQSIHCCVTSPPYWGLRDYGADGQLGLESTPDEYVAKMVEAFRQVRRVMRDDGTLWMNLGDRYAAGGRGGDGDKQGSNKGALIGYKKAPPGFKPKDLCGIPWRVALALQEDGWYLRQDIIWHKPNPMPESITDRCTKSHEYIFLLSKSHQYYYDCDAIKDKDRNKHSVWTIPTKPYKQAHFATFPPKLIEPCILAGCPEGGTVLDPFNGAGTTTMVAHNLGRNYLGIELNEAYCKLARKRLQQRILAF